MDIFVVRKDIKKTFILRVEPTDTILNVKEKIQAVKKEKGGGVALDQQLLTIENDFELEDIRPLSFYCLGDGSSIFLVVGNPLVLAVYFMEQQKELKFQIESGDSIMDLKQRIEQETSIPLKEQQLCALLEDTMPVSDLCGQSNKLCFGKRASTVGNIRNRWFYLCMFLLLWIVVLTSPLKKVIRATLDSIYWPY